MLSRLGHWLVLQTSYACVGARLQDQDATAEHMHGVVADALTDG